MNFAQILELAKEGNADAQYAVGSMYLTGEGVEQNYVAAFGWISKAANQGVIDAQHDLALMYKHGDGVEQDINATLLSV